MDYAGLAFAVIGFGILGAGIWVGRLSVGNQIKVVENATHFDLEVELDDKGVLTIR
jgi:hypothetical protein